MKIRFKSILRKRQTINWKDCNVFDSQRIHILYEKKLNTYIKGKYIHQIINVSKWKFCFSIMKIAKKSKCVCLMLVSMQVNMLTDGSVCWFDFSGGQLESMY